MNQEQEALRRLPAAIGAALVFTTCSTAYAQLESSPVSTSDRIDVRASFDPRPQIENWEERQGVVAWERSIAPEETVRIALNDAIAYPRDAAVAGLP